MAKAAGPSGHVIAFEPLNLVFNQMCENINLNGLTNVRPYNLALGHADNVTVSMVPVNYDEDDVNIMNTCVGVGGDLVQMRTLDSFELSNVSLLKIDVQGLEPFVLKGAESTIARNRPFILLEIEEPQLKAQNITPAQVIAQVLFDRYIMLRLLGKYLCDYVCVPKEKEFVIPAIVRAVGLNCEIIEMLDGRVVSKEAVVGQSF
jgi:FkbM family methyltransferase